MSGRWTRPRTPVPPAQPGSTAHHGGSHRRPARPALIGPSGCGRALHVCLSSPIGCGRAGRKRFHGDGRAGGEGRRAMGLRCWRPWPAVGAGQGRDRGPLCGAGGHDTGGPDACGPREGGLTRAGRLGAFWRGKVWRPSSLGPSKEEEVRRAVCLGPPGEGQGRAASLSSGARTEKGEARVALIPPPAPSGGCSEGWRRILPSKGGGT